MKFLQKYADNTQKHSIVNKWRRKRFSVFIALIEDFPRPVSILDIGGTQDFWEQMGFIGKPDANITILNTAPIAVKLSNFRYVKGDARDLSIFKNGEFDVVFSNSVIEHVGRFDDQRKMAEEIRRTGKKYFVQTPNYYFPVEPHFLFPFFQFFPKGLKILLLKNFRLGWFDKCRTHEEALAAVNSVRLLKKKELEELFPGGVIHREKFFLLTKSFMVTSP